MALEKPGKLRDFFSYFVDTLIDYSVTLFTYLADDLHVQRLQINVVYSVC